MVQPVPAPFPLNVELISSNRAGGNSQKLRLFILGKAISGAPTIRGTNQLPYPPIRMGITMKNIMVSV